MPLMRFSARRFRLWNWIVLVTMLFATLAPGAVAVADPSGDAWMQVCTSAATTVAAGEVGDGDSSDEREPTPRIACVFCLAGAHGAVLPAPPHGTPPAPPTALATPRHAPQLRAEAALLPAAPPRAPPLSG